MITYSAILDVPRELAWYLAGLLNDERYWRRTRRGRRALTCYRQAVLVLRWFLDATRVNRLARDNQISLSTAYRYLHEGIDVLAWAAPDLHEVLAQQRAAQAPYLILDGTLIPTDRVRTPSEAGNDLWYCGQHHIHGGNVQFLATPNGYPLWTSAVTPGSLHDITAAREHCLGALVACRIPILADKAYRAAGIGIHAPVRKPWGGQSVLHVDDRTRNSLISGLRSRGERAMALIKTRWRALHRITLCPWRIGDIVAAALVLTHYEHQTKRSY